MTDPSALAPFPTKMLVQASIRSDAMASTTNNSSILFIVSFYKYNCSVAFAPQR